MAFWTHVKAMLSNADQEAIGISEDRDLDLCMMRLMASWSEQRIDKEQARRENAALHKRASEAESERDSMLSACVSAGWYAAGWYAEGGDPEGFILALRKRVEDAEAKSRYWWAEAEDLRHQREDLRKRVEELTESLQIAKDDAAADLHNAVTAWRKRVEELKLESKTFEDQAVFYQARAEQAERERASLQNVVDYITMRFYQIFGRPAGEAPEMMDSVQALQADLNAALLVMTEAMGHSVVRLQDRMCSEGSVKAWRRVEALLEKRRENRG